MANLRNYKGDYNIGLDMGTGSVGWAVTDSEGKLLHFKKQPTWGSRLFDSAETAASARIPRGQRRRYVRRRWRLDLLQQLFQDEVSKTDPEFFIRLRQSRLLKEDREEGHRDYNHPLFNDSNFTETDYYNRFPTIYHLRKWLMKTDEKADIRLVYLAAHNIVKHRGNFLRQENTSLSAKNARPLDALREFRSALVDWCAELGYECDPDESGEISNEILSVLEEEHVANSDKKKRISSLIGVAMNEGAKESKACNDALAGAMVGLKAEFKNVFGEISAEQTSIYLSNDEAVDALREGIPDEGLELFGKLCSVYSAYVLQGLLSYAPGQTISVNMVAKYEKYGNDLKTLKALVCEYARAEYDSFFRGEFYRDQDGHELNIYNASKAQGYTRYNLGTSKMSYEDFEKAVKKLFAGTAAEEDGRYLQMMKEFGEQRFLRRLKTSDNGSIYYQLHLEELTAILSNQGKHYPFLVEDAEKIKSLVSFRIPYYVGPLTDRNARKDKHGKNRFAWSERKSGMEDAVITPWNWDEVIDRGKSAEAFITRMTGMCTYLQGEDVLPKCSLLYEEFCVLNELNGSRWGMDGDKEHRFDAADREAIIEELFKKKKTVKYKDVANWLEREAGRMNVHVMGGQGETGYESKLSSYYFFRRDIFDVEELDRADYPMIEQIILWNTLFEDRKILKEKLEDAYGPKGNGRLDGDQIKKICRKRFTGWGRLSKKFLTGIKVDTDCGPRSIMDVLREGDPNAGFRGKTMVMMEVLRDENLGFQQKVDEFNKNYFGQKGKALEVNELPGSPAIRRSLNQAIRIVDEIAKIAGKDPESIFIEVTRDDELDKRGKRTKRRYDALKEALTVFKKEDPEIWAVLQATSPSDLDERLTLYFMQRGKCLYSGEPIDINKLSSGEYEVDHIIPRSYIKDDSLENKALVCRKYNQSKTDAMLLDPSIRRKMRSYWDMLLDAKLIGPKKHRNLLRDHIDEKAMKGFVARQLVETSQSVKLASSLLSVRYSNANIVPVKASMSHDLREAAGFVKCREANDFHHAHDAYLACRMGLFIQMRHPKVYENPIAMTRVMQKYAQQQSKEFNRNHRVPGTSGFIVNSFMSSGFDKETGEIFKDTWNAETEIEGIRKALNYRQCYISRMPMEDTGAFWNATVYSPRDPKMGPKLALPLKKGLDPKKYGGFSSQQFAYFFVYEARDKKGKQVFRFAEVPVWLASQIESDKTALERYATGLAEAEKLKFVRIERAKILKKQLIEIDGDRFILTGKKEMRNGRELALSQEETLNLIVAGDENASLDDRGNASDAVFDAIVRQGDEIGLRLYKQLKIAEIAEHYRSVGADAKVGAVMSLLSSINASSNMVNLSMVGGSKYAGNLQPNYSNLLSDPETNFVIIDQSVTGMFERRTRIGL